MFETAELGRSLSREEYDALVPELRTLLLKAQTRLDAADFPVIVLIHGVDGAGKGDTANILAAWLDARYLTVQAYEPPSEEERERPEFWRYWMWLPRSGRIGLFLGSWYTDPILKRAYDEISDEELQAALLRINAFEKTLTDSGALIVKLWFHIKKKAQKDKLKSLESRKNTRWRVTKRDWRHHELYADFVRICEGVLRETGGGNAPWIIIESEDDRFRNVAVGREVLQQMERRLSARTGSQNEEPEAPASDRPTVLSQLDLSRALEKSEYQKELESLQARLNRLSRRLAKKNRSAILVFEGPDAAGKGGAIRRITWALDARQYRVIPVAAPSEEERAHHYLWRFWRDLPRRRRITIYDRSWYGRVLVERVEGLATGEEWMRAYKEINDFEHELLADGIILFKFWLYVSPEEQMRRFQEREREPWKQHKITFEDYRNHRKFKQYEAAASDMIARTSTAEAPFVLVEANDKYYARIKVLRTVCDRLTEALD